MRSRGAGHAALGRLVDTNNRRIRRSESAAPPANPRSLDGCTWHAALVEQFEDLRQEWDAFRSAGGRLPLIDDVIAEDQGNEGPWRVGLLVANGRRVDPLAARFERTTRAVLAVPGIRSAMISELDAGSELGEHRGPNAGVLRYHLGLVSTDDAALRIGEVVIPYRERGGILFDDTAPHAAWNRGAAPRVTLFLEVLRPATGWVRLANRWTQRLISLDARYRRGPERAAEWHRALNPEGPGSGR